MSSKPSRYVSRSGEGKQGYCKLCAFADLKQLNQNLAAGWNSTQIRNWLKANYDVSVTRQTIYTHRDEHAKHPADRVVTAVERAQRKDVMLPRVSSNEEYLTAIRDLGYRRAVENPDEVTIDHGLKAAQILSQKGSGGGNITILLAKVMTGGGTPEAVVEGEFREAPVQQ